MEQAELEQVGRELAELIRADWRLEQELQECRARQMELVERLKVQPWERSSAPEQVEQTQEQPVARGRVAQWEVREVVELHARRDAARADGSGTFQLTPLADDTATRLRLSEHGSAPGAGETPAD